LYITKSAAGNIFLPKIAPQARLITVNGPQTRFFVKKCTAGKTHQKLCAAGKIYLTES